MMKMITIFNREEIYHGYSMEECSRVRDILGSNNIRYGVKLSSRNASGFFNPMGSMIGNIGMNMKYMTEYYVYVRKKDFELASFLVYHTE